MIQLLKGYKAFQEWEDSDNDTEFTIHDLLAPMRETPQIDHDLASEADRFFRTRSNFIISIAKRETLPIEKCNMLLDLMDYINGQENLEESFSVALDIYTVSMTTIGRKPVVQQFTWDKFSQFMYDLIEELQVEEGEVQPEDGPMTDGQPTDVPTGTEDSADGGTTQDRNYDMDGIASQCLQLSEKCMVLAKECMEMAKRLQNQP